MPASLCHPPRHSQEHFAALSSDPIDFEFGFFIGGVFALASIPYIFVGAAAALLLGA